MRSTRRSRSSWTIMGPAADSVATCRAKSTSSMPRGRPRPTRKPRPRRKGIEWTRFVVGYDGITLVINPKNDFVKSLTVEQLESDLGAREQGQDLEGRRPFVARPRDRSLLARQRLGDVRVLHRGDRRQGQEPARRRAAKLRRQHARATASPATAMGLATSATPITPPTKISCAPWPSRPAPTPSRCCQAPRRSPTSRTPRCRAPYSSTSRTRQRAGPKWPSSSRSTLENVDELAVKGGYDPPTAEDKAANSVTLTKLLAAGASDSPAPAEAAK